MMRHFTKRNRIRFRTQNIETVVNLERIRAHDFGPEPNRNVGGQFGFSGGRRTGNVEGSSHAIV